MPHLNHCHEEPGRPMAPTIRRRTARTVHLALAGMGCPNCATRVRNALLDVDGVVDAEVDLPAALAKVWYVVDRVAEEDLVASVRRAGHDSNHRYLAVPLKSRFAAEG